MLKIYQVDAFTDKIFSGNPAAVCPLEAWIADDTMQKIAAENNLAETVFYVKNGEQYDIRWFTPAIEVDLCGHATLAAAFVLFNFEDFEGDTVHFYSHRSGALRVSKQDDFLTLDFPTDTLKAIPISEDLAACFAQKPLAAFEGKTDIMLVFDAENSIKHITPYYSNIEKLPIRGIIATAKGTDTDFVSRFFAPQSGVNEDPVTGSAHTSLIPFWAEKLGKNDLIAQQISPRGGFLKCQYCYERVKIGGQARLYLIGEIFV